MNQTNLRKLNLYSCEAGKICVCEKLQSLSNTSLRMKYAHALKRTVAAGLRLTESRMVQIKMQPNLCWNSCPLVSNHLTLEPKVIATIPLLILCLSTHTDVDLIS